MVIIYPNADSTISVIFPSGLLPIEQVALKDVPYSTPYLFVQSSDLPTDAPQESWEADFSAPDGYGLGAQRWFIQQAEAEIEAIEARTPPEPVVVGEGDDPAEVEAANAARLAAFNAANAADIDRANALIAQMQAEIEQPEGGE